MLAGSHLQFVTSGTDRVRIDPSGNMGIGTTTPGAKLDVAGTTKMTGFKLPTGATNNYVLTSDATGLGTWQPAASVADGDWTIAGSDMYSAVSGNVGIGTTTPGSALDVSRDAGSGGIQEIRIGQLDANDGYTRLRAYQDATGYALSGNWAQGTSPNPTSDFGWYARLYK